MYIYTHIHMYEYIHTHIILAWNSSEVDGGDDDVKEEAKEKGDAKVIFDATFDCLVDIMS